MTMIFAHRGYSSLYPENTMKAFVEAEYAGADGVELDVQMTKDGHLVVIHDEKVDRTTDGIGYIKDLTLQEIRKLNARYKFKNLTVKTPVPMLEEVFEWMSSNNLVCNIELKNGVISYQGMEEKVIELIERFNLSNRIILSSFNHYSIVYCKRIAPNIETAPLLAESLYMPWVYAKAIKANGIHPKYFRGLEDIYKLSMENGVSVRTYTVNKEAALRRLFALNCTGIITDEPKKALAIKNETKR